MDNRYLSEMELDRMKGLLKIADRCRSDVLDDFLNMILDKIDCDVCPMHEKCENEAAMHAGCEYLPDDIEPCYVTVYNYISSEAG